MDSTNQKIPPLLSGTALKLIAVVTMALDHFGAVVIEMGVLCGYDEAAAQAILETSSGAAWFHADFVLRIVGRIAFPLFCFLLAEGFLHTRSRKKYLLRLAAFAVISEVPFDLAIFNRFFEWGYQNVYFTLAIGLGVLMALERLENARWAQVLVLLAGCGLAMLLRTDYDVMGVLLIAFFYLFRRHTAARIVTTGAVLAIESSGMYGAGVLALVPIALYNGERGKLRLRYVFYWFYPVHLLLLFLVRLFVVGTPVF